MRDFLKNHPIAIGLALVMHVLLLCFFVVKFDADRDLSGGQIAEPIKSELIITGQQKPILPAKPTPPKPDPRIQQRIEEEKERARLAEIEKAKQAEKRELEKQKLEEEIKKQEQEIAEKKRLAEIQKQQEVEERKLEELKRKEEEEQRLKEEAEQKLAAEKLEQERLAKEEADRLKEEARKADEAKKAAAAQAAREAELDAQLAEEEAQLKADRIAGLRGQYIFAIRQRVQSKWYPQDGLSEQRCRLEVTQAPNGTVLDVRSSVTSTCTEQMRDSVEKAVYRSDPLPEAPSREVFERIVVINFCTPDVPEENCQ